MKGKRGQITVFIVVGIILLFAVGFVLYAASLQSKIQVFGVKENEIQQYIGVCLKSTSQEAITRLGISGGYIEIPENIAVNQRAYFSYGTATEPKIPLWYYRGEPRIPTKTFMEKELSSYIEKNVEPCFKNFQIFQDRYTFEKKGNLSVETQINDNDVFVKLNYPLEINEKTTGKTQVLNYVSRTIGVKLGKMYRMAVDILRAENEQLFFENETMNLLTMNPNFPFTGMDLSCKQKTWKKSQLIDFAKNMISYNIMRVTLEGNPITWFRSDQTYAKNHFVFSIGQKYPDLGAAFYYPTSARLEMHVFPNDRENLKSTVTRMGIPLLRICMNSYHFTYNIEYPLLTILKDKSAFDGNGFTFNFAFPVTINHNEGDKTDIPAVIYETTPGTEDFCDDLSSKVTDIRVKDAFTYADLYDASVEYVCVKLSCDLGATTSDLGSYRLRTKLPARCTNGILRASAEGYLDGEAAYDESGYAEVYLKPIKKFNLKFVKHNSDNFNNVNELLPGETVILSVTGKSDPKFEEYFTNMYNVSELGEAQLNLIDGDAVYDIEAYIMEDGERLTGGYVGNWSPSYGDMAGKSDVVFHLVQYSPIPVTEAEQAAASEYLFEDKSYQEPLKPTFS